MRRSNFITLTLTLLGVVLLAFVLYAWIRSLPRTSDRTAPEVEISPAAGEAVFWGKGRCHVCHRVGERGYARRGPDLGAGAEGLPIGQRARQRASETGVSGASEYLLQSVVAPGAFLVPGYANEMPEAHKPPVALSASEIKAVVRYLESLGGTVGEGALRLPDHVWRYYRGEASEPSRYEVSGDVAAGRALFFDEQGPAACSKCHVAVNGDGELRGGDAGPDLSAVASIRTPEFIRREILDPNALIVSGYQTTVVKTTDGRMFVGVVVEESNDELVLQDASAREHRIPRGEVASLNVAPTSLMPGNYRDLLTDGQMDDLMAYLLTLTGEVR